MFVRLADFVTRHWILVVVLWLLAVTSVRLTAPRWESVTHDGDFAYLPAHMPSVTGERWMTEAFPWQRGRSQVVIAIARPDKPLTSDDIQVAYDVGRRLKNLFGAARLAEARRLAVQIQAHADDAGARAELQQRYDAAVQQADEALFDALEMDEKLADYWDDRVSSEPTAESKRPPRLAEIYHNRSLLDALTGDPKAARHHQFAVELNGELRGAGSEVVPGGAADLPLVDAWTWRESYFGDKLVSRDHRVRLVVLQLTNEFMAVDNIRVLEQIESTLAPVRDRLREWVPEGLFVFQSGSAAVGADLLRSAAASIAHTEITTIVLVVLILAMVYRAPLLVAVPVITIVVSLLVSTGLVALLTRLDQVPGFGWWTLKIFSTTRIFIVVILFGAGTDFCLFLIARYKEELQQGQRHEAAVARALAHVGDALAASALTTVMGLGMMFFAEFGKFCYSGPIIGLCLAVTLLTCLTLTPAIMTALGPALFWPWGITPDPTDLSRGSNSFRMPRASRLVSRVWHFVAWHIVTRPGTILTVVVGLLLPLAGYGFWHAENVTYDFLSELPATCPSKQGTEVLRRHFPVGESGPVTVLVHKENAQFESPEGREQIRNLSGLLHLPGVETVRSAEDPLGEYAPGEKPGILSERGRMLRVLRAHPRTKAIFVAQSPELIGSIARFELILAYDPFSLEAIRVVDDVQQQLQSLVSQPDSFWSNANYALTGTTSAIRDLRTVTRRDNVRIQMLVVLAVLAVLLAILRRPAVCLYMMASVLLSYYVTLGLTILFFSWTYGDSFQGLDWKVPLFLFVILVAVGQDYNVYLATRVFEEQQRIGPFAGLRRAVVCTGGIITSCGIIMAGTFISMTSSSWSYVLPAWLVGGEPTTYGSLRAIVEMGFALALGVLIDTFVVRPILVPAFLALLCRWRSGGR